jgi:predicted XRE-type DNA-binding protein
MEKGSGNVYRDLGVPDSEDMMVKAQLVGKIAQIIEQQPLTPKRPAAPPRLRPPAA